MNGRACGEAAKNGCRPNACNGLAADGRFVTEIGGGPSWLVRFTAKEVAEQLRTVVTDYADQLRDDVHILVIKRLPPGC